MHIVLEPDVMMPVNLKPNKAIRSPQKPHVLIVESDSIYGQAVANVLKTQSICSTHTRTVDDYLDQHYQSRVDLVSLEVDVFKTNSLEDQVRLRTHFGEGPGTKIVTVTDYAPSWFLEQLLQSGADVNLTRRNTGFVAQIGL